MCPRTAGIGHRYWHRCPFSEFVPRGASFTGIDIAENQIKQAQILAEHENMSIDLRCLPAEKSNFSTETFDVVTTCQCFTYFNHNDLAPYLYSLLRPGGKFAILYMAWLPFEDMIAEESEELVLKFNLDWTVSKAQRQQILIPEIYFNYFSLEPQEVFDLTVPFTRKSWHGRMRSCRGIGGSLSNEEIAQFDSEHQSLLNSIAPPDFNVLHYSAITVLKKKV